MPTKNKRNSLWLLWRAVLIVHFSKDSHRPLTSALSRIFFGYSVAILAALLIKDSLSKASLPSDLPEPLIFSLLSFIGFVLGGLVMLTMGSVGSSKGRIGNFQKILSMMPIPRMTRWLISIVPGLVTIGMVGSFGSIMIWQILGSMGDWNLARSMFFVATFIAGLVSGYGLSILPQPRNLVLKGALYVGVVSLCLFLLDWSLKTSNFESGLLVMKLSGAISLLPATGLLLGYLRPNTYESELTKHVKYSLIPDFVPVRAWFVVKFLRNSRTRNSFLLALSINTVLALAVVLKDLAISDPHSLLLVGAILAATFSGDTRGVIRKNIPPEMVLLNGASGMVWSQIRVVLGCGVLVGLPLLFALNAQAGDGFRLLVFYICLQFYAVMAGLLAGAMFVPSEGETGAQFFTGIIASASLVAFPKIAGLSETAYFSQSPYWLIASVILAIGIYLIETTRRKYYGRT